MLLRFLHKMALTFVVFDFPQRIEFLLNFQMRQVFFSAPCTILMHAVSWLILMSLSFFGFPFW